MLITHLKERGKVGTSLLSNSTHDIVYLLYLKICLSAPAQSCSGCLCQRLSAISKRQSGEEEMCILASCWLALLSQQ